MTIVPGWATKGNWALSAGGYFFIPGRLMPVRLMPVKTVPKKPKWYTLSVI
jgi:hypothetical protein